MQYNVYLREVGNSGLDPALRQTVQGRLQGWFNQVVSGSSFDSAVVQWVTSPSGILDHELLVYFCRGQMNSVIRARLAPGASRDEDGLTMWPNGVTGSEVYVFGAAGTTQMDAIAEVAFHECMHNKLQLDNALHQRPGLAARAVGTSTHLHPSNVSQMRAALPHQNRQWIGGFDGDAFEGL